MATAREAAARDVHAMSHPGEGGVHSVGISNTSDSNRTLVKPNSNSSTPSKSCSVCGKNHCRNYCLFKDTICFGCNKKGLSAKVLLCI